MRIIVGLLVLLAGASACWPSPSDPSTPPASSPRLSSSPGPPSATLPASVWVLTPNGLSLRSESNPEAAKRLVLAQGTRLDVIGARQTGEQKWLQVHGHDAGAASGWIVDDSDKVTRTEVVQYSNTPGGYSLLYPHTWVEKDENPNTSIFTGGHLGHSYQLTVQTSDDSSHFTPPSGRYVGQAARPVLVSGATVFIKLYKVDGGGVGMTAVVTVQDHRNFLFLFREMDSDQQDVASFEELLDSVSIFG